MTDENDHERTAGAPEPEPETRETPELEPETERMPPRPGAAGEGEAPEPKRLLRSRDDRMLAGVAGGLGEYFAVDPIIIRIAFGISILFGGLGIVAYLAAYLFVPVADGSDSPQAPAQRSRTTAVLAIAFIVAIAIPAIGGGIFWGDGGSWILWLAIPLAAAIAAWAAIRDRGGLTRGRSVVWAAIVGTLGAIAFLTLLVMSAVLTAVGEGVVVALGLAGAGILLVALGAAGVGRWLILPVAAIALGVSASAAADLDLGGGIGDRVNRPTTVREIPPQGYELGLGRLAVDLRGLEWGKRVVELDLDLGIGEAVVVVPSGVCVVASGHVGAGDLRVVGEQVEGLDIDVPQAAGSRARPRLRFSGDVELGALYVVNDDDYDLDGQGPGGQPSRATLSERNSEACSA